jgi:2-methylcitrate dehydratase PrpD
MLPPDQDHAAQPGTIAAEWASFVTGLEFATLPAGVVGRMRQSLLDSLGAAVLGSETRACQILLSYLHGQGANPDATVLVHGTRTSSVNAAMVNSAFVHSTELWEFFDRAAMPPNIFIPATALALAERTGASGQDVLTAMVAGYEIAIRVGLSIRVDAASETMAAKDNKRPTGRDGPMGFYLSGATFGVYGATAAAAKLLRLGAEQTAHALTLCSSLAPVIGLERSSATEAAMPKEIYMAVTAGQGVMAAELAARGFTGRTDVTPHLGALVADYERDLLTRELGEQYFVTSGGLQTKLTAGSYYTQSTAAATQQLRAGHDISVTEIDRIDVYVNERAARKETERNPPTVVAARSSLPYILSAVLTASEAEAADDPHLTRLYTEEKLRDPVRRDLAQRVNVHGSAEYERSLELSWPPRCPARVTIALVSGQEFTVESDISELSFGMTDGQVADKFSDLASRVLPKANIRRVIDEALHLDGRPSVAELIRAACL